MKTRKKNNAARYYLLAVGFGLLAWCNPGYAQDSASSNQPHKIERAKNTFYGNWIINDQSVMVPVRKTLEVTIQHRFGVIDGGYSDFYGLFTGANIRIACAYTPIDNLQFGIGITENRMQWDGNVKYALTKQALKDGCPLSVTYYGDMAVSTIPKEGNFVSNSDRMTYFNQLIFARKVTKKLSLELTASLSYFNNVEGYFATDGTIQPEMKNTQMALGGSGCYMISDQMGIVAGYNQPMTQNTTNNPHPDLSLGIQIATFTHTFQIFVCNYDQILQQDNNFYNQNDFTKHQFLIGFNIAKRWNYQ